MQQPNAEQGIERLVKRYADAFQIPENVEHYSPDDFTRARRQFVRFCLEQGPGTCRIENSQP
ncbi:MAG: hypothetical protein WBY88_14040 [Desulfosarcina sp.]